MHIPVLQEKVLEYLAPQANQNFIDCTIGSGGHAMAILERTAPNGRVLGIDWDQEAIKRLRTQVSKSKFQHRLVLRAGNFADIKEIAQQEKFQPIHGIFFDLGFSSDQVENEQRGLSFQKDGPLDMRYSSENPVTAEKLLNYSSKTELEHILQRYGEEQFAKEIAEAILQARAQKHLEKTSQLVRLIEEATPKWYWRKNIHPATKTFQALRIAVNNELENIKQGLRGATDILAFRGRIVAISFHSLEDRIVKDFLKSAPDLKVITKKPIGASQSEIRKNRRARCAKLRAAIKI